MQLPSILTESLAIHLLNKKAIIPEVGDFTFGFGGRLADIIATKGNEVIKIEVKATAKSAFEYFGNKDIVAEYIVWVHFAEFFMSSENSPIKIFTIKRPENYFKKPVKITLSELRKKVGKDLIEANFDMESL